MRIKYSNHLRFRLGYRKIPYDLPKDIYNFSDERYYDTITKYSIAIKTVKYRRKKREMAVTYKPEHDVVVIITIHPLKRGQKENRINRGRWIKR